MAYRLKIWIQNVVCRETESEGRTGDLFTMAGVTAVDGNQPQAFELPWRWLHRNQSEDYGELIFDGFADTAQFGIAFKAWDLDHNRKWRDNREDVIAITKKIKEYGSNVPIAGVLINWAATGAQLVEDAIDFFVDQDKDDELANYQHVFALNPDVGWQNWYQEQFEVKFKGSDPFGYSDWDYSVFLTVSYSSIAPSLGQPETGNWQPMQNTKPATWIVKRGWEGYDKAQDLTVLVSISQNLGLVPGLLDVAVKEIRAGQESSVDTVGVAISRVFLEAGQQTVEEQQSPSPLEVWHATKHAASNAAVNPLKVPGPSVVLETAKAGNSLTRHALAGKLFDQGLSVTHVLREQVGPDLLILNNQAVLEIVQLVNAKRKTIDIRLRYLWPVPNVLYREATATTRMDLTARVVA
jgi:hypothetical protein